MPRELTHVVSFRTTAALHRKLDRVRVTFPNREWGEFHRWLFEQPEVQAVMDKRLDDESPAGADGSWGIELSLPVGDR